MTNNLQKRFIIVAMSAITLLIVAIVGVTNVTNLMFTRRQIIMQIETLYLPDDAPKEPSPDKKENRRNDGEPRVFPDIFGSGINIRNSIHFTVKLNADKSIDKIDLNDAPSVDITSAERIADAVIQSGQKSGIEKEFLFRYTGKNGNVLAFLYIGNHIDFVFRVAVLSLLTGILSWWLMFLTIFFLSKKAIKPIAENMERQRKFVTDAGHELKTPLAIILANTEALELHNGESKWSKNIRNQVSRLDGLTKNLLTLAKIESSNELSAEKVSFSQIVEETVDMFEEYAAKKNLKFNTELQDITVKANKIQLNMLVSILIDNAVKYSSSDSEISIKLYLIDKKAKFTIENQCDSLPECDSDELFQRFYRGNDARTQKDEGYGIGLSAAKAIVEAHSGTISAKYKDNNVIRFKVTL